MKLFHHSRSAQPGVEIEPKDSVEINIAIDGQSYMTGMGVSAADLEAKIDAHLQKLQSFYGQQSTAQQADEGKTQRLGRLNRSIQSAQADKQRRVYDRCLLNIAEGYESWAIIDRRADAAGQTGWDYAWGVLNKEMLGAIMAVSEGRRELLSTAYVELLFARGMHCLREMKSVTDAPARQKYAELAVNLFYTYLLEVQKLGLSHWQKNDAIKNIHIASQLGGLSEDQLQNIIKTVLTKPNEQASDGPMTQVVSEVNNYKLATTDHERLEQLIY